MSKRSFATTSELETPSVVSSSTTLETGAGSRSKHRIELSHCTSDSSGCHPRGCGLFFLFSLLPRAHSEKKVPEP